MDGWMEVEHVLLEMENTKVTSLYQLTLKFISENSDTVKIDLDTLPVHVAFDICDEKEHVENLCSLKSDICHLSLFDKILQLSYARNRLHQIFQSLEEHKANVKQKLCIMYCTRAGTELQNKAATAQSRLKLIHIGLRLGTFLSDAAWYDQAQKVLSSCRDLCLCLSVSSSQKRLHLEILHHLLRVQAVFCNLQGAKETYSEVKNLISQLTKENQLPNLSAIYTNFSFFFFICNDFKQSYEYSIAALRELNDSLPPKTKLDTLRQASRSCVVKRQFHSARILIEQALDLARHEFGYDHIKYADTQLDYGFFLLNHDSIHQCVAAYESAYTLRSRVFMKNNIHVAVAMEDLAYALYVYEYSSGQFRRARHLAEGAIAVMQNILPTDHIMLSSAQRVKALILEEIAIDMEQNVASEESLLKEAERLHLCALRLGRKYFGEKNVQTAKHYGNLGRLYQSMKMFDQAEKMHKQAIEIKETILGPDDYEVGLSVGHLASLYNYHMKRYDKAIELYLRSIQISLKLFGPEYSGLEYDYRGLIHVYEMTDEWEKARHYNDLLVSWRLQRDQLRMTPKPAVTNRPPRPIRDVVAIVLSEKPTSSSES